MKKLILIVFTCSFLEIVGTTPSAAQEDVLTYTPYEFNVRPGRTETVRQSDQRIVLTTDFTFKLAENLSFVLETFVVPQGKKYLTTEATGLYDVSTGMYEPAERASERLRQGQALIIPGIRWEMDSNTAVQFGFTGLKAGGDWTPTPIPMVQCYWKI